MKRNHPNFSQAKRELEGLLLKARVVRSEEQQDLIEDVTLLQSTLLEWQKKFEKLQEVDKIDEQNLRQLADNEQVESGVTNKTTLKVINYIFDSEFLSCIWLIKGFFLDNLGSSLITPTELRKEANGTCYNESLHSSFKLYAKQETGRRVLETARSSMVTACYMWNLG